MKSKFIVSAILVATIMSCSEEEKLSQEAFKEEKKGNESKALFLYSKALKINPDYEFANRRTGYILSESMDSIYVAIYHLEKAYKKQPSNIELGTKLIDTYLLVGQLEKTRKMLNEKGENFPSKTLKFLENMYRCMVKNKISIEDSLVKSILAFNNPKNEFLIHKSKAKCLRKVGLEKEADSLFQKYMYYKVED